MYRSFRSLKFVWLLAGIMMTVSGALHAEIAGDKSKFGFGIEGLGVSTSGYQAIALGFRNLNYFGTETGFSWGYQVWVGSSSGITGLTNNDHLYYGGFNLGNDGLLSSKFTYEFNVLVGYSDTNMVAKGKRGDSLVIEPSAGVGFLLGYGWRGELTLGYLYTPNSPISGMTIGLRLDRKVFSSSHGADY